MATLTVDTDGVSGTYANLDAGIGGLSDPLTEDMIISCDASTGVKDTTDASGHVIDTTSGYTLTIIATDDYIYSPPDAAVLSFAHAFGNTYNVIIDGVSMEKPSMSANYQEILEITPLRDGDIIIKNCRFISDSGVTYRERIVTFELNVSYNATVSFINNYVRSKGSSTDAPSACIGHISDRPVYMYNNTIVGYRANYTNASNALYINNVIDTTVAGGTVSASSLDNMFSGAFYFNANDEQSQTFTFVNLAIDDVHLQVGDTGARGKGTDLSADGNFPFDYDQDGVTRSAWDAGAFEFVAAGGPGAIINQLQGNNLGADLFNGSLM